MTEKKKNVVHAVNITGCPCDEKFVEDLALEINCTIILRGDFLVYIEFYEGN